MREAGDLASRVDGIAVGVGMGVVAIAKVNFTSQDRVRNVIHNFNAGWFVSQYPTQAEPELRQVKTTTSSEPGDISPAQQRDRRSIPSISVSCESQLCRVVNK